MNNLRKAAEAALEAMESNQYAVADTAPHVDVMGFNAAINALRAALAEPGDERAQDDRCPTCSGPADNGHDRSVPPAPYLCTSCMSDLEPPWIGIKGEQE